MPHPQGCRHTEMQDRAVVVTGGASGIGKATTLLLAREVADVMREPFSGLDRLCQRQ